MIVIPVITAFFGQEVVLSLKVIESTIVGNFKILKLKGGENTKSCLYPFLAKKAKNYKIENPSRLFLQVFNPPPEPHLSQCSAVPEIYWHTISVDKSPWRW